jgi:ATP-binding cassette subfamily B protein
LQQARVSLDRVAEMLGGDESGERGQQPGADTRMAICLDDVRFNYAGKSPVLNGLNLRVAAAEKVAVFGASGAGKSTLVQLLFGLRSPDGGSVKVHSHDALGYASADPFLLHASVRENLRYGNPLCSDEAMVEAARLAEATRFILSLPQGFETVIGGRGHALSDGQRQRLGLARLFLADPEVLVLDEAFSAMDPETEARVRANLFRAFADRAVLAISHRLSGLEQFDRLLLMEHGRLRQVSCQELLDWGQRLDWGPA